MKKKLNKTSLSDIAKLAGVSTFSVSYALRNKPRISSETREKILRIAKKLGYTPNARLSTFMAQVRGTAMQEMLPIAWLNTNLRKDAWQRYRFLSPYLEGAQERAGELGYKIEEIWGAEPGMTMGRLAWILYQRGIEGVIVTFPARHFRLNWDHLAGVALGASLLAPRLHRVAADLNFNLQLALKHMKRNGYHRIGICLAQEVDSASHYTLRAMARDLYFSSSRKERIPPLFHAFHGTERGADAKEMVAWLKHFKPDAVVGHNRFLKQWMEQAGYRVPEDVGLIHLAVDDDVLDWAGIHSRRRETGAIAVDQVVALMRSHQYGVPKTPMNIMIRGTWQMGKTLRAHSTAKSA